MTATNMCSNSVVSGVFPPKGGLTHFPPKFAHFFVPVITFPPFLL